MSAIDTNGLPAGFVPIRQETDRGKRQSRLCELVRRTEGRDQVLRGCDGVVPGPDHCRADCRAAIPEALADLAGQHAEYLDKQIKAFRDGTRIEPTMQPFVATLTDADAADLAAFFASRNPCQ
jgi:hypothetical protein